jgi:uncharacterized protein DUF3800
LGAMFYRLFIDETGTHDLSGARDPNNRFLSLTGLIFRSLDIDNALEPWLRVFKERHFGHVDDPPGVILHRKEIVNRRPPFDVLFDPENERAFNADLLRLLAKLNYKAITVTIDKRAHLERYSKWHHNPYHYCMDAMLERYCMQMNNQNMRGDVMIESRDKKLDKKLKKSFQFIYQNGTMQMNKTDLQRALTTRELKLKPKSANVAGLQLCDLLAHPACVAARCHHDGCTLPDNFGGALAEVLEGKYRRSYYGQIDGYGRKWLS